MARLSGRNKRQAIRDALRHHVRAAKLRAGDRIASTHELGAQFGASYVTTHSALDDLVKEGVLVRIQGQGTFVAESFDNQLRTLRIALPCSEKSLSPEQFGARESWGIVSEQYRGMIEEAREQHAEIDLLHVKAALDEIEMARQVRRIGQYDGALFFDPAHDAVRDRLRRGGACVTVSCKVDPAEREPGSTVCAARDEALAELARHLARRGCRRLRTLTSYSSKTEASTVRKIRLLERCAAREGLEVPERAVAVVGRAPDGMAQALAGLVFEPGRDALFCAATDHIAALYRHFREQGLQIGRDLAVVGYGSGFTFHNLAPSLSYSRVDHYGMGRMACRMIVESVRGARRDERDVFLPNQLVVGESA